MRKFNSPRQRLAGFTIIEVLMAAAILTVGFMGLVEAVTMCSGMMDEARRQTLATQILNQEIESLRFHNWTDIKNLTTAPTTPPIDPQFAAAMEAAGASFSLAQSVSYIDPNTNANSATDTGIAECTLTVTWVVKSSRRDSSGQPVTFTHSRTNTSYIGKYGLNLSDQRS